MFFSFNSCILFINTAVNLLYFIPCISPFGFLPINSGYISFTCSAIKPISSLPLLIHSKVTGLRESILSICVSKLCIFVLKRSAEVSVITVVVKSLNEPDVPCINEPLNDPLNTPWPVREKDDEVALSANEAVAAGDKVVALAATEAEVAVTVGAKALALVATEAVCASIDVDAEVAVTVGAKPFALIAIEAVWANIAVDEEIADTPVKSTPLPEKDPLKVPLTNKLPVKVLLPLTLKPNDPVILTELEILVSDPVIWKILPVYFNPAAPLRSLVEPLDNNKDPDILLDIFSPPEVPDVPDVPTLPDWANNTESLAVSEGKFPLTYDTGIL